MRSQACGILAAPFGSALGAVAVCGCEMLARPNATPEALWFPAAYAFVGGIIGAIVAAAVLHRWPWWRGSIFRVVALGILIGLVAISAVFVNHSFRGQVVVRDVVWFTGVFGICGASGGAVAWLCGIRHGDAA